MIQKPAMGHVTRFLLIIIFTGFACFAGSGNLAAQAGGNSTWEFLNLTNSARIASLGGENISLYELEKLNLLTPELEKTIFENFQTDAKKIITWINLEELKAIFNSIDKEKYFVNLGNISFDKNVSDYLFSERLKKRIVTKYNDDIEINNSLEESFLQNITPEWKEQNIHPGFVSMIKEDENISPYIRNTIDNFKVWSILTIENIDKQGKKSVSYYLVKKLDHWSVAESKMIILEDITLDSWYRQDLKWPEEKFLYEKFYNLLLDISNAENKNLSIKFYQKEDLDDKELVPEDKIKNSSQLKNRLDTIDSEGSTINFDPSEMVIEDDKNNFVFLIEKIDDTWVFVNEWKAITHVSFNDFYDVFKEGDLKRARKVNDFNDFKIFWNTEGIEKFGNLALWWKNKDKIVLDSDIKNVDTNSVDYPWIRYFVWSDGTSIKINSISENSVDFVIWEFKENEDWKIFKTSSWQNRGNNFSQLFFEIKKHKMTPYTKNINNIDKTEEELIWEKNMKWSLLSRRMSKMSISDMITAFKFFPDTIKKNMERWNRLKALKFAQNMAKGVAWSDSQFYLSMKSSAEQEEKSLTDEIVNNLKSLGSQDMIKQIEKILFNKDSEEYELVAAMMTVIGKYWSLYPKHLKKYSGSLIWYKRLWWTNEFLRKHKEEIDNAKSPEWKPQPIYFTEERLVESWLWKRAKNWTIRSRLDKDYGWALAWGMNDEMDDWAMKAGNKITTEWRISYFLWELKNLGYANAVWAIDKVLWKNASSFEMNAVPFVLAVTEYSKNFDQVLLNKVMWMWFSSPFVTLLFNKDSDSLNLYSNFIRELIKDKLPEASEDFEAMKSMKNPEEKVKAAYKFWTSYWKTLNEYISLRDPYVAMKSDENPVYDNYYKFLRWVHSDPEFNVKDDDITIWVYEKNPIALSHWWITKISSDPTWGLWRPTSKEIYMMYINELKKLRKYDLEENWVTEDQRKKVFKETFEFFSDYIKDVSWRFSKFEWEWNPIIDVMVNELWAWLYDKDKYLDKQDYLEKSYYKFINHDNNKKINNTQDYTKTKISELL